MAHLLVTVRGVVPGVVVGAKLRRGAAGGPELRRSTSDRLTVTVLCDGGARYLSRFWNRDRRKRGLAWPRRIRGSSRVWWRLVAREGDSVV